MNCTIGLSQMQMGIVHDNINVTEGIRINPALAVDPMVWLDVHAVGLYVFGSSNAAYLAKEDFNPLLGQMPSSLSQNLSVNTVSGQIEGTIMGPALNVSLGKFSVGVSSAFRNYAVGRSISKEFAQGLIYGLQLPEYYGDTLTGDNYRAKAVSFIETGVNGGMILHQKGNKVVNIGINAKYLLGIGGVNFLVDNFSYSMIDSTDASVFNYTGKYGGSNFAFHPGTGYAIDMGITYEKKVAPCRYYKPHSPQSNCKYVDYEYRIGFSILDLGSMKFKGSAYREVSNASGNWTDYSGTRSGNINEVIEEMDNVFANGITQSSTTYKAKLPLSFALQFDYNFGRGIYVNSSLIYGVALKNSFGGERLSMLAVTPRFEGKRLGVSVPLSINSFWRPGLGLAIRYWFLTIGTDNLAPYLINMDVYRLDVYAHIKVPIFVNPKCRKRGLGEYDWKFSDCSAPGAHKSRKHK